MITQATKDLPQEQRGWVLIAFGLWIFIFAKTVKLMGHFIRYPADILLLPLSILFGYLHGIIKLIGLCTLSEVSQYSCDQEHTSLTDCHHRLHGEVEKVPTKTIAYV